MPLSTDPRTLALQAQTNGVVFPLVSQPKADIVKARAQASFATNEMAALLAGSAANLEKRRKHLEALKAEPIFSKVGIHDMSREQRVERALAMAFKLVEVTTQVIDSDNPEEDGQFLRACIGESLSLDLHFGMYMTTIMSQGSSEQINKWLPPAAQFVHIGTYAQTELGHGTYLRGLETTATYDKVTEEFVLHSPTMSAVKWWPGCLAKVCNHCVLMARLFIDGTDYGPHPFMLQIRRLDTHECMPGIELSDIGPKFGFNGVDNGTMRLSYVRIPRANLLMKNSQVSKEGVYTAPLPTVECIDKKDVNEITKHVYHHMEDRRRKILHGLNLLHNSGFGFTTPSATLHPPRLFHRGTARNSASPGPRAPCAAASLVRHHLKSQSDHATPTMRTRRGSQTQSSSCPLGLTPTGTHAVS